MIFDCFTFYNELDLLKIRFHVHAEFVDQFVLVEATRTFQGTPKPLFYLENKEEFKDFDDRVIHVIVDNYPSGFRKRRRAWKYEYNQRDSIFNGLIDANADDKVIISDVDEIIKPSIASQITSQPKVHQQHLFYYYLNGHCCLQNGQPIVWNGPVSMSWSNLKKIGSATKARFLIADENIAKVQDAGWHFSYLGGPQRIIEKIESFSHTEFNTQEFKSHNHIEQCLNEGNDLFGRESKILFRDDTNYLPEYVLENIEEFRHLLKVNKKAHS